jgi:hypothetical protein
MRPGTFGWSFIFSASWSQKSKWTSNHFNEHRFVLFNLVFCCIDHCLSFCPFSFTIILFDLFWFFYYWQLTSDYRFTDFWLPLYWPLITALLTSDYRFTDFWLPLYWPLITALLTSDYRFTDFWLPLYWLLITALVHFVSLNFTYKYIYLLNDLIFTIVKSNIHVPIMFGSPSPQVVCRRVHVL